MVYTFTIPSGTSLNVEIYTNIVLRKNEWLSEAYVNSPYTVGISPSARMACYLYVYPQTNFSSNRTIAECRSENNIADFSENYSNTFSENFCQNGAICLYFSTAVTGTTTSEITVTFITTHTSSSTASAGRYNGTSWDGVIPMRYDGTNWVECELQHYDGSSWTNVDTQ